MAMLFWDASALVKRYFLEVGSDTVDALFAEVPLRDMATTPWGYVESFAILSRRHNEGVLDLPSFAAAITALQSEVADNADITLLPISDETIFSSISIIQKHNLNATDAAILTMLLGFLPSPPPSDFILIASDKRLLRAAEAEGFTSLNPELLPADGVSAFLADLERE